jgi:UrcA family protein
MFQRSLSAMAAAALAAGTVAFAVPAHAAAGEDQVVVSIGDLQLSNPADSARFERRVRSAARSICGTAARQPLDLNLMVAECQNSLISDARAKAQLALAAGNREVRLALRTR